MLFGAFSGLFLVLHILRLAKLTTSQSNFIAVHLRTCAIYGMSKHSLCTLVGKNQYGSNHPPPSRFLTIPYSFSRHGANLLVQYKVVRCFFSACVIEPGSTHTPYFCDSNDPTCIILFCLTSRTE
ncbi:hypothetical protein CSKR_202693 [Clonorchis sinensis]|uniref:Secreted protein n=1 Tax=Clonorchis sinensis TaxID=79923 RepID=A0A8T1M1Z3_CLOSI|nr:hypothetical protein CSKR_202693 [Clonorchis sinensis]